MILALAGNPNCGKTTLFNQLTGSNQHVGNFPGVTVDQKSGPVRGQKDCTVVDLPKIGITGNSHFMFQELNNKEIADHIYQWLESRALA